MAMPRRTHSCVDQRKIMVILKLKGVCLWAHGSPPTPPTGKRFTSELVGHDRRAKAGLGGHSLCVREAYFYIKVYKGRILTSYAQFTCLAVLTWAWTGEGSPPLHFFLCFSSLFWSFLPKGLSWCSLLSYLYSDPILLVIPPPIFVYLSLASSPRYISSCLSTCPSYFSFHLRHCLSFLTLGYFVPGSPCYFFLYSSHLLGLLSSKVSASISIQSLLSLSDHTTTPCSSFLTIALSAPFGNFLSLSLLPATFLHPSAV